MIHHRASAVLVALVLVLPLAPRAEASEEATCAGACSWLPLYVTTADELDPGAPDTRGMASLPGDAAPGPASVTTSRLVATTREIDGIPLARASTFQVLLDSPDDYDHVRGNITVSAIDVAGGRVVLARKEFTPPGEFGVLHPGDADGIGSLGEPIGVDTDALREALGRHVGTVQDAAQEAAEDLGTPAGLAVDTLFSQLCREPNATQCRAIDGRPLFAGAFDACTTRTPQNAITHDAVLQVDDAAQDAAGRRVVCHSYWREEVAPVADAADAAVGPAAGELVGAAGDALDGLNASGPPAHQWRNATLDAVVPSWMRQDGDLFHLPSGYRLELDVSLVGVVLTPGGPSRAGPVVIEYGRIDTLTALAIRHARPGAFASLSRAETIGPGDHTGDYDGAYDARDHAFVASAGSVVDLTELAGEGSYSLYDPDGRRVGSSGGSFPVENPGLWILRVANALGLPDEDRFAFSLRVGAPEPDEGVFLPQGSATGALGPGDDVDTYGIFLWKAQRFTIHVEHPTDARYRINVTGTREWDVSRTVGIGYETYSARSTSTGSFPLRIFRDHGAGAYSVTVSPDPLGNHTVIPAFAPVLESDAQIRGVHGHEDGVFFSSDGAISYYSPEEGANVVRTQEMGSVAGVSASGALLTASPAGTVLDDGVTKNALAAGISSVFGPDGLYGVETFGGSPYRYFRMDGDRTIQRFESGNISVTDVLVAPDGSAYVTGPNVTHGPQTYRFDLLSGALVPAPSLFGVVGFDTSGGAYRILNDTLVERVDLSTGQTQVVARGSQRIAELGMAGASLYATHLSSNELAVAPMGHLLFDGFEPAFAPPPPPDLLVANVRDRGVSSVGPQGEVRTIEITVENVGASAAIDFDVEMYIPDRLAVPSTTSGTWARQTVPALAPGERVTLSFEWSTGLEVGDREIRAWVDPIPGRVVESNETNNMAFAWSFAWVVGAHSACVDATAPLPDADPPAWTGFGGAADVCRFV